MFTKLAKDCDRFFLLCSVKKKVKVKRKPSRWPLRPRISRHVTAWTAVSLVAVGASTAAASTAGFTNPAGSASHLGYQATEQKPAGTGQSASARAAVTMSTVADVYRALVAQAGGQALGSTDATAARVLLVPSAPRFCGTATVSTGCTCVVPAMAGTVRQVACLPAGSAAPVAPVSVSIGAEPAGLGPVASPPGTSEPAGTNAPAEGTATGGAGPAASPGLSPVPGTSGTTGATVTDVPGQSPAPGGAPGNGTGPNAGPGPGAGTGQDTGARPPAGHRGARLGPGFRPQFGQWDRAA